MRLGSHYQVEKYYSKNNCFFVAEAQNLHQNRSVFSVTLVAKDQIIQIDSCEPTTWLKQAFKKELLLL